MNSLLNTVVRKTLETCVFTATFLVAVVTLPIFAHAATFTYQMELGDTGDNVSSLQTFLAKDSTIYPEGLITGFFGPMTVAAVKRYQAQVGLSAVGRVGPATLASLNGTPSTGGTSGDISAPITTSITVSPSSNSAAIVWNNNEAVYGRVMYGTSWPFLYATAPSAAGQTGFNTTQSVTLSGLSSNTTYVYVLEATDAAGNLNWTIGNSFRTR